MGILTYPHLEIRAEGPDRPLAILFSDGDRRPLAKDLRKSLHSIECSHVVVTAPGGGWYRDGIPGLGSSIEEAAAALRRITDELRPTHVVTVGASMAGYGAVVFGCLIHADRIVAFGAETQLMLPGSRSQHDLAGSPPRQFVDLLPHLQDRRPGSVWLIASEADIIDLYGSARASRLPAVRAVAVRGGWNPTSRGSGEVEQWLPMLVAALDASSVMPKPERASDLLDDLSAITSGFEAHAALLSKRLEEAERHAAEAIDRRPDWALAHHLHGRALALLDRHGEAEAAQTRAVALDPDQPAYHHHLGLALAQLDRFAEAAAAQQAALDLGWSNPWALHHLGTSLHRVGDFAAAEAAHRRAIERRPNTALFHYHLGLALTELGRLEEAEDAFTRASEIEPGNRTFARHRSARTGRARNDSHGPAYPPIGAAKSQAGR